jgi:hypothetical protein
MDTKGPNKRLTILIGILVILAAFFVYRYYSGRDTATGPLSATSEQPAEAIDGGLLKTLLELKSISIDTEFFKDGWFTGLKDFSKPLPQQPVGRRNPFAPIGVDVSGAVGPETRESAGTPNR